MSEPANPMEGMEAQFLTGAKRQKGVAGSNKPCRYDLITPVGLRRLAETYGEGALKYGDRNWEKGIPNDNLLNHLIAHINQYMAGDRSEDHLAHAAWGLFALMHFEEIHTDMNPSKIAKCTCGESHNKDMNCPWHGNKYDRLITIEQERARNIVR